MRIDLAALSRPLRGKIIQIRFEQRGIAVQFVQRASGECGALASSLALVRTGGGEVCSGVLNNPDPRCGRDDDDNIAIGIESSRPRITGVIQSSNGSETA